MVFHVSWKHIIRQLVTSHARKKIIYIWDEVELTIHLKWQSNICPSLSSFIYLQQAFNATAVIRHMRRLQLGSSMDSSQHGKQNQPSMPGKSQSVDVSTVSRNDCKLSLQRFVFCVCWYLSRRPTSRLFKRLSVVSFICIVARESAGGLDFLLS